MQDFSSDTSRKYQPKAAYVQVFILTVLARLDIPMPGRGLESPLSGDTPHCFQQAFKMRKR